MKGLGNFVLLVSFFTRLPLPEILTSKISDDAKLSDNICFFPIIGLFIGILIASVWFVAISFFPPIVAAGIAISSGILLTGALHEDGLADTADGLGATSDRAKALEIMRDSRIGTYGVLALLTSVALRWTTLSSFDNVSGALALIMVHMVSRSAIPIALRFSNYARSDGLGTMANTPISNTDFTIAMVAVLLLAMVLCGWSGLAAASLALLICAAFCRFTASRIGGYTGDTLGATQQFAEVASLIILLALLS